MTEKEILRKLYDSISNMDIEGVKKACEEALAEGVPPLKAVTDGLAKGLTVVGQKFEAKEYFLPELIMAGETMKEAMKILEPHLRGAKMKRLGKVVLGTVKDDLHDIGKDIVGTLLEAEGFEVIDLGVDVPREKFVEAVRTHKPMILGMSALTTPTMPEMGNVIRALEEAKVRGQVKVIVGGAPVTKDFAKIIGADAFAPDAVKGIKICKEWVDQQ